MQTVGSLQINPTHMVSETSYSCKGLGKHASSMTLYADRGDYFIEWDIPSLEMTENIGLTFEHKTLVDYDGVFSLPKEAVKLMRQCGFRVPRDMI